MPDKTKTADQDRALFRRTVGPVQPIRQQRICPTPPRPHITVKKRVRYDHVPERARDTTPSVATLTAEDQLYYLQAGIQKRELKKLYRGHYPIARTLDLHQITVAQAHKQLISFILQCSRRQAVKIIHGKGHNSLGRQPILKNKLNHWLRQLSVVLAFCSARPNDGGTGAVYVLIKAYK